MPENDPLGPPWDPGLPGIIDCREMYRGRSRQASIDGVPQYVRVFLVRTSTLNPNMAFVAASPGPVYRDPYPDDPNARGVESTVAQDGESPFHYKVTLNYKYLDENDKIPWLRPAVFSFSGSLASQPAFWYYSNESDNSTKQIIVNTAGDPLSGLDRDEAEFNVTIQYNQKPPFNYGKAQNYVGAINSDTWSGGAPKTWKCQGIQATRKFESIPGENPEDPPVKVLYFDTTMNLSYRASGWDLQTWDVGFNQIVGGQRVKILAGSEPVSEPVALSNGQAKPPGQPPDMLTFRLYKKLPFVGTFEELPTTTPSGYPYNL